jgi:anti-sigma regulatory factor (Ser/Thr protein kinase)
MALTHDSIPCLLRAYMADHRLTGDEWRLYEDGTSGYDSDIEAAVSERTEMRGNSNLVMFALEESRGNVVKHGNDPSGGLCFFRKGGDGVVVEFLFADDGPGFSIEEHLPPYPPDLIGYTGEYRRTLDGRLLIHVVDATTVELSFVEAPRDFESIVIEEIPTNGMGLAIVAKIMSRVRYLSNIGNANVLWLQLLDDSDNRTDQQIRTS